MKVSIATITSNNDGNVEVDVKPFGSFDKAARYLYEQYLEIKAENEEDKDLFYANDEVGMIGEDECENFYIEDESGLYWVSGNIYTMEIE